MSVYGIPDEVYVRNRLDMINQNSHYGIMVDTEITKMVRDHMKELEEIKMKATSVQKIENVRNISFIIIENDPIEEKYKLSIVAGTNDDVFEFDFEGPELIQQCKAAGLFTGWEKDQRIRELEKELGRWKKEAADCLKLRDEAQKEAYKLKKKNEELKERLNNIEPFRSLERTVKEKQQMKEDYEEKIRELKTDNKNLTEAYDSMYKSVEHALKEKQQLKEEYEEKLDDLQHKYNLERGANEAQHKFFRQYAGEETEIEFNRTVGDDEVTYVIVDKEEYKAIKNCVYNVRLHGMDFTPAELVNRIVELEELKTPTIDNFADEEPSSRRDILHAAEKCVCGQREQDYGSPESNFQLIADLWNDYLKKGQSSIVVDAMDVAMMMALLKIARIKNGGGSGDSFVDLAGYAACGGEIWHGRKTQDN